MIDLVAGRYFAVIAFVYGERPHDWLGAIYRDSPKEPWTFAFRFREYVDDKAHDSSDRKLQYHSEVPSTKTIDDVISLMRRTVRQIAEVQRFNDQVDIIELRSDDPKYIAEIMMARPWCHTKRYKEIS